MASKSPKITAIVIFATLVLVGCGEKDSGYKVENPTAASDPAVGTAVTAGSKVGSSSGDAHTASSGVPAEAAAAKGKPRAPIQDHK